MTAYNDSSLSLAEDLINTYDTFLEQPEHLLTPTDLRLFLEQHGVALSTLPTLEELALVRGLRESLRAIWNAESPALATERLNQLFASLRATPRAEIEEDDKVRLTLLPEPRMPLMERLTLATALDIVQLLQIYGLERLHFCAADPCRDVFVDTSRNRTRRFCSDRCANRYNVAAFRERKGIGQEHKAH